MTRGLYSPWNSPGQNTGVAFPFSRGPSQPRDGTGVSRIAGGSSPAEPPGKPESPGASSLSLLPQTFLTQEKAGVSCTAGRFFTKGALREAPRPGPQFLLSQGVPGSSYIRSASPGGGNGSPLQYFCLENPMDRGAWWATVHGVTLSRTRLSDWAHKIYTTNLCTSVSVSWYLSWGCAEFKN